MNQRVILFVFAGRRPNMELQIPCVKRICELYPNVEYRVMNLAHDEMDYYWLRQLPGLTVENQFHRTRPRWLRFNQVYRQFAAPEYRDCLFVKIDDDVVFLQSERFGEFVDAIAANPGNILSANVINNGACARRQPGIWEWFQSTGEPQLDWHLINAAAVTAHEHFFAHWRKILAEPVKVLRTSDWLSINTIGFDWNTCGEIAERVGTPSPPVIAGRGFSGGDWIGDEGSANLFPRKIVKGFTTAHLSFAPQNTTGEQLDFWRDRYKAIGRRYLGIPDDDAQSVPTTPEKTSAARRPMPQYRIVRPCAYVDEDGEPVYHRTLGEIVELSPDVARILGPRVSLVCSGDNGRAATQTLTERTKLT